MPAKEGGLAWLGHKIAGTRELGLRVSIQGQTKAGVKTMYQDRLLVACHVQHRQQADLMSTDHALEEEDALAPLDGSTLRRKGQHFRAHLCRQWLLYAYRRITFLSEKLCTHIWRHVLHSARAFSAGECCPNLFARLTTTAVKRFQCCFVVAAASIATTITTTSMLRARQRTPVLCVPCFGRSISG